MTVTSQQSLSPASPASRGWRGWGDRFLGSDPGLNRLLLSLHMVVAISLALAVEWLFVHFTRALQDTGHGAGLSAAQAAGVAARSHDALVLAMIIGGTLATISVMGATEARARSQLLTIAGMPLALVPTLALGLAIGGHRLLSLCMLTVSLGVGTYLRRFAARGFIGGILFFLGAFLGFFLYPTTGLGGLGWLIAEVCLALLVTIAVRFTLFYPRPARALRRTQLSYLARARKMCSQAIVVFDALEPDPRSERRLGRQLLRLNEAALMIDARLADPAALGPRSSAQQLHQRLFDAELGLATIARLTPALNRARLSPDERTLVRRSMVGLHDGNLVSARESAAALLGLGCSSGMSKTGEQNSEVLLQRFACSAIAASDGLDEWLAAGLHESDAGEEPVFQPATPLAAGWLLGSTAVSAAASISNGSHLWDRISLRPYTRSAIQITVAVGAAAAAGDALSGPKFYWALLAAFLVFLGTNNVGEQINKALLRVGGTVVGIIVGALLVHAVGHSAWCAIAVVLAAQFFGNYLQRINYAFMVLAVTITVSLMYEQLGEYSDTVLVLRLEETAIGASIAILTVTFVVPLRSRYVVRVALLKHLRAMANLTSAAGLRLAGGTSEDTLRRDARSLDSAHHALMAAGQPMRSAQRGELNQRACEVLSLATAYRGYAGNLVSDVQGAAALDGVAQRDFTHAQKTLGASIRVLVDALEGTPQGPGTYVRSSELFDQVALDLERQPVDERSRHLAVRDFSQIDEALAALAIELGVPSSPPPQQR